MPSKDYGRMCLLLHLNKTIRCGHSVLTLQLGFRPTGTWIMHLYWWDSGMWGHGYFIFIGGVQAWIIHLYLYIFINKHIYLYVWFGRVPLWKPSAHLDFKPDMIVGIRFGVWDRSKTTSYIRNMWTSCAPSGDVTDYSTVPLSPEWTSVTLRWSHNSHWSASMVRAFYSLFLQRLWSVCFCFLGHCVGCQSSLLEDGKDKWQGHGIPNDSGCRQVRHA